MTLCLGDQLNFSAHKNSPRPLGHGEPELYKDKHIPFKFSYTETYNLSAEVNSGRIGSSDINANC